MYELKGPTFTTKPRTKSHLFHILLCKGKQSDIKHHWNYNCVIRFSDECLDNHFFQKNAITDPNCKKKGSLI